MASVIYDVHSTVFTQVGLGEIPLDGTATGTLSVDEQLITPPIDNSGLNRFTNNCDRFLFADIELACYADYGSVFAEGDWVELYMICELLGQDGTSFEDGDEAIEPPAANFIGAFQFVAGKSSEQIHILRQVPIPPLAFKLLLINKADIISNITLKVRVYRYKTLE